jgi:guanylate kinase
MGYHFGESKNVKGADAGMLIILVGPSSVGKTTIGREMEKWGVMMLKSVTTRDPRFPGENEYDFVSDEEFDSFEFAEGPIHYAGKRYGLTVQEMARTEDFEHDFVVICEVHGALELKEKAKCPCVLVFVNASDEDLVERLKKRGTPDIEKRIARFAQDREGIPHCDFTVTNSNTEDSKGWALTRRALNILSKARCLTYESNISNRRSL